MKPFGSLVALLLVFVRSMSVSAGDMLRLEGEVLYHQDFSMESELGESGIRVGTHSSENSELNCIGETLEIKTYDKGRVYAILPDIAKDTTYTAEFTFRFSEIRTENGYIALILNCRGDEPTNITSVNIRANGSIDDFDDPCEAVRTAIAAGEEINIQIPIRGGVLNEVVVTAGENQCVIERDSVLVIDQGQMGFAVRNACVEIPEIFVVHGADYQEKTGYYADASFSEDGADVVVGKPSEIPGEIPETSPETGDGGLLVAGGAGLSGLGLLKKRDNK